jgi:hypothetical protein
MFIVGRIWRLIGEYVERYAAAAEKNGYRVVKKRIEDAHHVQLFKGKGG